MKISIRFLAFFGLLTLGLPQDGMTENNSVPARKVPAWGLTSTGKIPPLPSAPVQPVPETEHVELIPGGTTMLRVLVFPDVGGTASGK